MSYPALILHGGITVEVSDRTRSHPDDARPYIVTLLDEFDYEVACQDGETEQIALDRALADTQPHPHSPVRKLNLSNITLSAR